MSRETFGAELEGLLALCRAGRLFDVEEWIRAGKPVARPTDTGSGRRGRIPLQVAMEQGFHSLVQVLLEGGAPPTEGHYVALDHAVELRRPDLAALLLEHGADVRDVSMRYLLDVWQPDLVELFLSHGASLVHDKPIAWALINKVRPALGLLKRLAPSQLELMQQADLALRHHARKGSPRWVALMLWVGADPWARGPDDIDEVVDEDEDIEADYPNAVELLVSGGHVDVLKRKRKLITYDSDHPERGRLLEHACRADDGQVLSMLLECGHSPRHLPDFGTYAVSRLLHSMTWDFWFYDTPSWASADRGSDRARERMRMVHILLAHGAKWLPDDKEHIRDLRRSMLKLRPPFILEFVWLMQKYRAARRRDVAELLRTPAIRRLLADERDRVDSLVATIPEDPSRADGPDGDTEPASEAPGA